MGETTVLLGRILRGFPNLVREEGKTFRGKSVKTIFRVDFGGGLRIPKERFSKQCICGAKRRNVRNITPKGLCKEPIYIGGKWGGGNIAQKGEILPREKIVVWGFLFFLVVVLGAGKNFGREEWGAPKKRVEKK